MTPAIELYKAHGLGNDYLVWASGPPVTPELARQICHRHTGAGGDGILEPFPSPRADHGIRIWNPDGSVAEKSGNGLRIASWWLHHERGSASVHTVDTGFDVVTSTVDGDEVTVQMGRATFEPARIPAQVVDGKVSLADGTVLHVVPVGTGNPHAVVFVDTLGDAPFADLPWRAWGAELEVHSAFPNRTNVQFARGIDPTNVEIRIWERGAGETSASGSSSCGVAAAAVHTGRCDRGPVTVHMPGGVLHVVVGEAYDLTLTGPVAAVARIQWLG
jgi:diaminopimelate epimerase